MGDYSILFSKLFNLVVLIRLLMEVFVIVFDGVCVWIVKLYNFGELFWGSWYLWVIVLIGDLNCLVIFWGIFFG